MPRKDAPPGLLAQRFYEAQRELQHLNYFVKGTVLKRMMKCGQPSCACHLDPAKRHGPYFERTCKAKGKTVNVNGHPVSSGYATAPQTEVSPDEDGTPFPYRL